MPAPVLGQVLAIALSAAISAEFPAPGPEIPGWIEVAQAEQATPRGVRRIAPDLVAPPEVETDQLERDAPRQPLSDIGPAQAPRPDRQARVAPEEERERPTIMRPVATAAGRVEGDGFIIAIAGIEIVEPDQSCWSADGKMWPCGASGRTAFRSFLRGRSLFCDLPEGEAPRRLAATCRVGGQDLGAWLVRNGWAKVAVSGPYAEEQSAAIREKRGIFGTPPASLPGEGMEAPDAAGMALPPVALPPAENAPLGRAVPLERPSGLY